MCNLSPPILGFDAFHLADQLLTQPVQAIVAGVGGSTGSLEDGRQLTQLARAVEDILVIEGARHYEMYDESVYIAQAVERSASSSTSTSAEPETGRVQVAR